MIKIGMLNKRTAILVIVYFLIGLPVFSYSADSGSLNSLIQECLNNNPQIRAANQRYKAAQARVRLLRTLADPKFASVLMNALASTNLAPGIASAMMNAESLSPKLMI